jgi:hypothetical protein
MAGRPPIVRGPLGDSNVVVAATGRVTVGGSVVAEATVDRISDVPVIFRRQRRLGQRLLDAQRAIGFDSRALTIEMLLHEIPLPVDVFDRGCWGIRGRSLGWAEAFEVLVGVPRDLAVLGTGADARRDNHQHE